MQFYSIFKISVFTVDQASPLSVKRSRVRVGGGSTVSEK
jgi:hypothetical protein